MQTNWTRLKANWFAGMWHLIKPYWTGEEKLRAFGLLCLIIALSFIEVYMAVRLNSWNGALFNAIERYQKAVYVKLLFQGLFIMSLYILAMLLGVYLNSVLEIKWRKWQTNYYLSAWFSSKAYYKSRFISGLSDNPDQRISEDIHQFVQATLSLFMTVFKAATRLVSFVVILWQLSGNFKFNLFNHHFYIPGYMVWIAIIYSLIGTYVVFKIGRPLIKLTFEQQKYEADFRYNLVRTREYAENVAAYGGEEIESRIVNKDFQSIVKNFMQTINRRLKINMFDLAYSQLSEIVPTLISAFKFFAHEINLGTMMRISSAFGSVQFSIGCFVFSYPEIANWRAVVERLIGFEYMIYTTKQLPELGSQVKNTQEGIDVENLNLYLPTGQNLIGGLSVSLAKGERLLIQGRPGAGKSTLLKAINGLWPYLDGKIYKRDNLKSLLISQKPYLPKTILKEAICYPKSSGLPSDNQVTEILDLCKIGYLADKLYETADWGSQLSLGEQQQIAFCRIIINHPDIVYLDEASSALDEQSELRLYNLIIEKFPEMIIVSTGHRSSLIPLHTRILDLSIN